MAGAAMMAGAAAASSGIRRRDEFGTTLETESRDLLAHFGALTPGALDLGAGTEDDLFKVLFTFLAVELKDRHRRLPFCVHYISRESKKARTLPIRKAKNFHRRARRDRRARKAKIPNKNSHILFL